MKILVFGAGVIGTLYAARLKSGGHEVTVLARGRRVAEIREHGLVTEDLLTGLRSSSAVDVIERLQPKDPYDLCLIAVRRDQLTSALPDVVANSEISTFLFMLNNPIGLPALSAALGKRVLLGFPGAGGAREGQAVRYAMVAQQPTMLGEPNGETTSRLRTVFDAFRSSGLRSRMSADMDGWLKGHAFFVTAISGAIYLAGGDTRRLARDDATLRLMIDGVKEGFAAVRADGHTVTPFGLRVLFTWLPSAFAMRYWRKFFAADMADYVFGRHARSACGEMREVANDCRSLLGKTGVAAPALHRLYAAIDAREAQEKQ